MAEKKQSTQSEKNPDQVEKEKLESVKKADAAVKSMNDFTSPEVLYDELIFSVKKYHPSTDISMIEKAYEVAREAHKDQKRKSGEPYIIHPLCVAIILADLELDKETIVAGLLHDSVEDTWMTCEELEKEFGAEVALLVDGVTKLGQLSYSADKVEQQAENLRKMFLAMAKDIRVILIKLADRLHNMRTLQYMRPEKQQEKARETMDIYAPIAMRLGISKIKVELDDLSLKYLKPDVYYDLVKKVALRKSERQEFVSNIVKQVKQHMDDAGTRHRWMEESSISSVSTRRWSTRIRPSIRFMTCLLSVFWWIQSRTVMRHLVSFMRCTSRFREDLRTILQCRRRICISLFIRL